MAENNNQLLTGKQQENPVQEDQNKALFNPEQNKDNELPKGGHDVIFNQNNESQQQNILQQNTPAVIFSSEVKNKIKKSNVVFAKNDDSLPDVVFIENDKEDLEKKKKELLEDLKNQEGFTDVDKANNENKLKKLAEIPVKEKNDYFFFVLVASTAIGGPVGFALASLACEKLGIQPGGVIGDSRSFNSDAITSPIMKSFNKIISAVNENKGYDEGLNNSISALASELKAIIFPKKEVSPISAKCLGETKNQEANQGESNNI